MGSNNTARGELERPRLIQLKPLDESQGVFSFARVYHNLVAAEKVKFFMLSVTDKNLGTWIYQGFFTSTEFDIKIVELAIEYGYDILREVWEADKPIFLSGMATQEMLEDLQLVADYSVGHLNELLPDEYYFDFDDAGLTLMKDLNLS